jgi:hypothetical protein
VILARDHDRRSILRSFCAFVCALFAFIIAWARLRLSR